MRDIALLTITLRAMRDLGDGAARLIGIGGGHGGWFAGPQPLNTQAVNDLVEDGWLRRDADRHTVRIDAWPSFARPGKEMARG